MCSIFTLDFYCRVPVVYRLVLSFFHGSPEAPGVYIRKKDRKQETANFKFLVFSKQTKKKNGDDDEKINNFATAVDLFVLYTSG